MREIMSNYWPYFLMLVFVLGIYAILASVRIAHLKERHRKINEAFWEEFDEMRKIFKERQGRVKYIFFNFIRAKLLKELSDNPDSIFQMGELWGEFENTKIFPELVAHFCEKFYCAEQLENDLEWVSEKILEYESLLTEEVDFGLRKPPTPRDLIKIKNIFERKYSELNDLEKEIEEWKAKGI